VDREEAEMGKGRVRGNGKGRERWKGRRWGRGEEEELQGARGEGKTEGKI